LQFRISACGVFIYTPQAESDSWVRKIIYSLHEVMPYSKLAYAKPVRVMIGLRTYADKYGIYEVEKLAPKALG